MFVDLDRQSITLAATDSYRLAEAKRELLQPSSQKTKVILPLRATQELRRALEGEKQVALTFGENQFVAETPATHLTSRLIDGTYPDYLQIIPKTTLVQAVVNRVDLLRAVRGGGVFTQGETQSVCLEAVSSVLRVTATAQELGETATDVPADVAPPAGGAEGISAGIHFNYRYLLDALSALPGERVVLQFSNSSIPAVLRPEGKPLPQTLAIVMPIKT